MQLRIPATPLPQGHHGILHQYTQGLVGFEYTRGNTPKPHTLIFIGGLGDGLATVEYISDLVTALQTTPWSIFAPILSSAYNGWGTGGLGKDIDEVALAVQYMRAYKEGLFGTGKVVVMGHSTGCQDVMHYLSCENPRPKHPVLDKRVKVGAREYEEVRRGVIDGAVIQAPVSDREAMLWAMRLGTEHDSPKAMREMYDTAIEEARRNTYEEQRSGDGVERIMRDTVVPLAVTARIGYPETTAISSRRFLSLVSPDSPERPDEDDIFSSDLGEEHLKKTFGRVREGGLLSEKGRLMVLYSGRDQSVPPEVNKEALLRRWRAVLGQDLWHPGSMIIPGASHALSDDDQAEPRRILTERVFAYLSDVERQA